MRYYFLLLVLVSAIHCHNGDKSVTRVRRDEDDNDTHDDHDHGEGENHEEDDHDDHDHEEHEEDDDHNHGAETVSSEEEWSTAQMWGYGVLANSVLVLLSIIGILSVKCSNEKSFQYITDIFLGLAVSTMLGDAILHIIPIFLGLHKHEAEEEGHEGHDHGDEEQKAYFILCGKLAVMVGIIYLFWLFESTLALYGKSSHGHSHGNSGEETTKDKSEETNDAASKWSRASGILLGDCMHNFVDGVAVGIAWGSGWKSGLGTTIAVLCHELPHELGGFIVYRKLGFSVTRSLLLNVFAAVISYFGLFTGLVLSGETATTDWLLALVAGLFVYVALCDVLPEMKLSRTDKRKGTRFLLQNIGMLLGYLIMLLLVFFEDKIRLQ